MNYDETRPDNEITHLRAQEATSDPVAFLQRYEDLAGRDRRQRQQIKELEAQLKASSKAKSSFEETAREQKSLNRRLEQKLRKVEDAHRAKRDELQQKLSDTQERLIESVREDRRLREDLQRVRGSRTFRVGKAVLSPTKIFRGSPSTQDPVEASSAATAESSVGERAEGALPQDGREPETPEQGTSALQAAAQEASAEARTEQSAPAQTSAALQSPVDRSDDARGPAASNAPAEILRESQAAPATSLDSPAAEDHSWESPLPVGQRDLDTLRHEFEAHPSSTTLYRVLNRSWHGHGLIDEPAQLILGHPDLVAGFTDREAAIAGRVLGDHRLRHEGVPVPPRSEGVAYLPEPERVMYCVHSTPVFNSNGYSTRTRGVANGFHRSGTDVRVVARAGYPWDTRADVAKPPSVRSVHSLDDVQYVHLPGSGLGTVPMDRYLIEAADAFTREALLQRPSVIQAASNYRTALPALIAARRVGVPFVYEIRGFWEMSQAAAKPAWDGSEQYRTIAQLETMLAQEADHVLAITSQVRDELMSRGIAADKVTVAPNAVDTDEFAPLPKDVAYAKSRKIRTDVPVIGFAGSMVGYEGLSTLIEASADLSERGVEHQVVIAGSGSADEELRALRTELGAKSVMFLGRRPIEEMPRLLSTFDIVPLPRLSLAVTEMVSPLKPLEAFSTMKAVLMSDVAPHRDLAGPAQNRARLFHAGDAASLAHALADLLADPDARRDLGRSARLWALDERTWTTIAATMRDAHGAAVRDHAATASPDSVELDGLTIGLIADEFTTKSISASVNTVAIDREHWLAQLEQDPVDLVLVESAWSGNDGQWHRGVGAYEPQEHQDIRDLLGYCRENGITTAFWNKEDPIHFARFEATAALCDHVFTTDGGIIGKYLATPGSVARTASSMPFYAQPAIHNPLPTDRPYRHTVAYAGTYYGDRYKERSRDLYRMLEVAAGFGLTIYDRQAAFPESPYHFPPEFSRFSEGALPYDEVIDSYKSHLAHLNGNSVMNSPSMFSRRVVEIAACGGIALSGPGRGVEETFGGLIPASKDAQYWRALLHSWSTDPVARVREAWRQMRAVHRSHTVLSAMTLLLRTAGIPVRAPRFDEYSVVLTHGSAELAGTVLSQSYRPREVFVPGGPSETTQVLEDAGITVRDSAETGRSATQWIGLVSSPLPRTWFEDLVLATRFGSWDRIDAELAGNDSVGRTLAAPGHVEGSASGLVATGVANGFPTVEDALRARAAHGVTLLVAEPQMSAAQGLAVGTPRAMEIPKSAPRTVLVAGHDLKFAGPLLEALEGAGHTVLIDQWESHTQHDEARSLELLAQADTIFCEWGLGNAVWYSKHVRAQQRLIVRVHSQELFRPYLSRVNHARVDHYLFVGELIRRAAVESHGVPEAKTQLIPNFVRTDALDLEKIDGVSKTLGFVGIVPRAKRLDLAVDVLAKLLEDDPEYRLVIKGKRPEEYPWMAQRPEEMDWYREQYDRIEKINASTPGAITFDPQGDDMPQWYRKIGIALSASDFESFHLTVADGAASGSLPASLAWAGSDFLYPREWLSATTGELAASIHERLGQERSEREEIVERYAMSTSMPLLMDIIAPSAH